MSINMGDLVAVVLTWCMVAVLVVVAWNAAKRHFQRRPPNEVDRTPKVDEIRDC